MTDMTTEQGLDNNRKAFGMLAFLISSIRCGDEYGTEHESAAAAIRQALTAPRVPDELCEEEGWKSIGYAPGEHGDAGYYFAEGWNACLEAMLTAAPSPAEPFAWVFTDVNGNPSELCDHPKHAADNDLRVRTPLYRSPAEPAVEPHATRALRACNSQQAYEIARLRERVKDLEELEVAVRSAVIMSEECSMDDGIVHAIPAQEFDDLVEILDGIEATRLRGG